MKQKPLLVRLFDVLFPEEVKTGLPSVCSFPGTEEDFWDYLDIHYPKWTPVYPMDESKARVVHYHNAEGTLVAICVRWPQRNYYYTVSVD